MKDLTTKIIYCALIVSVVSFIFAIPTFIVAIISSIIAWLSGWSFGWMFSIGLTITFLASAALLNTLYTELQDYKIELDLNEDEEDLL